MNEFNENIFRKELDKELDCDGDLILIVACTKCLDSFELSKESIAMAIGAKDSFIEYLRYLRWIQGSKHTICNGGKDDH